MRTSRPFGWRKHQIGILTIVVLLALQVLSFSPAQALPRGGTGGIPPFVQHSERGLYQQLWISNVERDIYSGTHINMHVQNLGGGVDYHNYHITYLGEIPCPCSPTGEIGHVWRVVDTDGITTRSDTLFSVPGPFFKTDAADIVAWEIIGLLTADGTESLLTDSLHGPLSGALLLLPPFTQLLSDMSFVIDTTGSMYDDLDAVKASATQIVDSLAAQGADFQISVIEYNDPYARTVLDFSSDRDAIVAAINSLSAGGGGDFPEHVYGGLMTAIGLGWREGANKSIVLLGDAPPKDPEPGTGYTQASVTAAANAGGIAVAGATTPLRLAGTPQLSKGLGLSSPVYRDRFAATMSTVGAESIRIFPVQIGSDSSTTASFTALANGTGGQRFTAATASQVVAAIMAAIDASEPTTPATLKVQYRTEDSVANDGEIRPWFKIVNTGSSSIPLSELKIRYWYTVDGDAPQTFNCAWANVNCANVTGTFVKLTTARPNADSYLEIGFTSAAGSIAAGADSGEIKTRFNKQSWAAVNETNDYSYDATTVSNYIDWSKVTLYRNGTLIWGTEP